MFNVEFIHNNQITIVQCNQDDKMKEIINKFLAKTDLDRSSVTFLYSGILIDEKTNISEIKAKARAWLPGAFIKIPWAIRRKT